MKTRQLSSCHCGYNVLALKTFQTMVERPGSPGVPWKSLQQEMHTYKRMYKLNTCAHTETTPPQANMELRSVGSKNP